MTRRGFSSSTKNLKYFAVLLLGLQCIVNAQPADSALGAGLSWSARFPSIDLFNLPAFGRSLFGATERPLIKARAKLEVNTIDPNIIEDSFLKTPELVKKYGYPAERHHVETEDGYILELHRIARPGGVPVLLTHGLLDSSATWVIMGPNKGLAYHLFDRGYDVWMTNVRGNTYSRNHTKYRTSHAKYWDFSFHEMGVYDLPASIDYVLNVTQYKQLHYIGHSQGTMIYWVMCSERPEYSDKVLLMQALAPVSFVKHCRSPVVDFLAFFQDPLAMLLKLIGAHEFLPSNEFVTMFNQIICDDTTITTEICSNVMFLVAGFDKAQLNETMIPVVLGHAPAGASTKQMQHFGQLKRSGKFRQYDYGWIRNHWRYNSITPPDYKLQNVRTKVALHYSANDWLATTQDVNLLAQNLPNVVGKFKVNYEWFNHLDFVWSIDAYELLYKKVFELMAQAESGMKNKMNNKTAPKEEEEVE